MEKPTLSSPMKPTFGVYCKVVLLLPTVAVPLLGSCVMATMVVFLRGNKRGQTRIKQELGPRTGPATL
jgi:hypothetical protein